MRTTLVTSIALLFGCTLTPGHGMGGAFGDAGSGAADDSGDGAAADDGTSEGGDGESSAPGEDEGGAADESSEGAGTFDPMGDSSSEGGVGESSGGEESTGAPADGGDVEPGGAYAACNTSEDCGPEPAGLACLHADQNGAGGFCSAPCGTYGATPPDPNLCPDAPEGVSATVVCLEGLVRNCALSCTGDSDCPDGTACLMANNGHGPYCFGLGA